MTSNLNRCRIRPRGDNVFSRMDEFHRNKDEKMKQARRNQTRFYMYSMAVILIAFGVYAKIFNYSPNTIEYIYDKHYKTYVVDSDLNNNSVQAIQSYREGDFHNAIKLFTKASKDQDFDIPHKLYLATSYSECHKFNEAITLYEEILSSNYSYYHADASWYLGLCYLKRYDLENARKQFKSLANSNEKYRQKAFEIMELIEEFDN